MQSEPVQVSRSEELGHTISVDACNWRRNRDGREVIIVKIIDEGLTFHVPLVLKEGDELGRLTATDYTEAVRMIGVVLQGHQFLSVWVLEALSHITSFGIGARLQVLRYKWRQTMHTGKWELLKRRPSTSLLNTVTAKVRRQTFDGYSPSQWWFGTLCAREAEETGLGQNNQVLNDDWSIRQLPRRLLFVPTLGRLCVWPSMRDHVCCAIQLLENL